MSEMRNLLHNPHPGVPGVAHGQPLNLTWFDGDTYPR